MRVLLLTHYFPPEVGAPQTRIAAVAQGLAARGHRVTVHTGIPHYPGGHPLPPLDVVRRWVVRERLGAIRVVRTRSYLAPNRGTVRRLLDHATFAAAAVATSPLAGPADVVLAESPPLFTAAAGVAYARAKRAALAINVADLWPASAVELGVVEEGPVLRAATWLEAACYAAADLVTAPTQGIVAALEDHPDARGKAVRVPPAVDLERFAALGEPARDGPLRVLYAGTVGMAQGLETLVEAARLAGPQAVEVTVAGDGAERGAVADRVRRDRVANVRLVGPVAAGAVPGLYASCDAAVVLLRDRPLFAGALPTKLFEAMAAARPVVLAARGEAAELLGGLGAGLVAAPEDPRSLADALRRLAADRALARALGARGRAAVLRDYGVAAAVERWEAALEAAVARAR